MEIDILDSLEDLGYDGPMLKEEQLQQAFSSTNFSAEFMQFVNWVTTQLSKCCKIDEVVFSVAGPEDTESFLMELNGFIRACNCPYRCLTEGSLEYRFLSRDNKLRLINYLLTELQAAQILLARTEAGISSLPPETGAFSTTLCSDPAGQLKQIMIALNIPRPPTDIDASLLFKALNSEITGLLLKHKSSLGVPLLQSALTGKQWEDVEFIAKALDQDYGYRRQMLLQRLDVTVQSFTWSERLKEDKMAAVYQPIRRQMTGQVHIDTSHVLAARDDMLKIQKASSEAVRERMQCGVNRVVIGVVPDRGGRAYELGPPPPEMPSFQQRRGGGSGQQRDRGG